MEAGGLDGMQTFDQELERLIHEGVVDRELALSYATNRTNLQLKLDTQGDAAHKTESIPLKPQEPERRTGSFRPATRPAASSEMDDLIER
jgi:hypothetical protein